MKQRKRVKLRGKVFGDSKQDPYFDSRSLVYPTSLFFLSKTWSSSTRSQGFSKKTLELEEDFLHPVTNARTKKKPQKVVSIDY
jgi:hypothetical protein